MALLADPTDVGPVRRGEMTDMVPAAGEGGRTKLTFDCPSRGLIGYNSVFANSTSGSGIITRSFKGYEPHKGPMDQTKKGSLIAMAQVHPPPAPPPSLKPTATGNHGSQLLLRTDNSPQLLPSPSLINMRSVHLTRGGMMQGPCTGYSLMALEPRGVLFVEHGTEVYAGMIVGEHSKGEDMEVNPTKEKRLNNIRNKGSEEQVREKWGAAATSLARGFVPRC